MTAPATFDGHVVGHVRTPPPAVRDGDTVTVDCRGTYYTYVNDAVRQAFAEGAATVRLDNVNGQRYIGTGLSGEDRRIEVHGTPGQALGMFMDGPTVEVFGNAQDGVGNTMNGGRIVVHGSAGDVLGYGMRCGRIYIRGDVGYRVGIHMKAYQDLRPVLVCGGKARDFFGEYMAGGLLVLLGMGSRLDGPVVGGHLATGMHGGEIYVRGEVEATCSRRRRHGVPGHRRRDGWAERRARRLLRRRPHGPGRGAGRARSRASGRPACGRTASCIRRCRLRGTAEAVQICFLMARLHGSATRGTVAPRRPPGRYSRQASARTAGRPRNTSTSATPMRTLAMATHCGCVSPASQTGLRRANSTAKRSTAERIRNQPKVHQPDLS